MNRSKTLENDRVSNISANKYSSMERYAIPEEENVSEEEEMPPKFIEMNSISESQMYERTSNNYSNATDSKTKNGDHPGRSSYALSSHSIVPQGNFLMMNDLIIDDKGSIVEKLGGTEHEQNIKPLQIISDKRNHPLTREPEILIPVNKKQKKSKKEEKKFEEIKNQPKKKVGENKKYDEDLQKYIKRPPGQVAFEEMYNDTPNPEENSENYPEFSNKQLFGNLIQEIEEKKAKEQDLLIRKRKMRVMSKVTEELHKNFEEENKRLNDFLNQVNENMIQNEQDRRNKKIEITLESSQVSANGDIKKLVNKGMASSNALELELDNLLNENDNIIEQANGLLVKKNLNKYEGRLEKKKGIMGKRNKKLPRGQKKSRNPKKNITQGNTLRFKPNSKRKSISNLDKKKPKSILKTPQYEISGKFEKPISNLSKVSSFSISEQIDKGMFDSKI